MNNHPSLCHCVIVLQAVFSFRAGSLEEKLGAHCNGDPLGTCSTEKFSENKDPTGKRRNRRTNRLRRAPRIWDPHRLNDLS